jgi:hypothetical protein
MLEQIGLNEEMKHKVVEWNWCLIGLVAANPGDEGFDAQDVDRGRQREPDMLKLVPDRVEGGPGCRVAHPSAGDDVFGD